MKRRIAILLPNEPLCCPRGHAMKHRAWAPGGMLAERCDFRIPPGRTADECGAIVYWLRVPGAMKIVAEVTSAEAHEMEEKAMCIADILEFLGLRWPRAAA